MALTKVQLQVLAKKVLNQFPTKSVYINTVNTDYEGEIKGIGSEVKVIQIADIVMKSYTKDTDMEDPDALTDSDLLLQITEEEYFNVAIDDIDAYSTPVKLMDALAVKIAEAMAKTVDEFIASKYTEVPVANQIGDDTTPIVPDKTTAYDYLVDAQVILDENNVPEDGRYMVVSPWFAGMLGKDDRFTKSNQLSGEVLMKGMIGEAAGFTILKSNRVPNTTGTKYKFIGGTKAAHSFAMNINKVKEYEPEKRFATAFKGLQTYGSKVMRPTGLVLITANKA